jgi:hypothetical protein
MLSYLNHIFLTMPKERPGFLAGALYGMSGASFAWAAIDGDKIKDGTRLKDSLKSEMTNTGVLSALVLTITCGALLNNAPDYIPDERKSVYFVIWCAASLFLAYGVLVSIIALITIEIFHSTAELEYFRKNLGPFLHIPLYFLIAGGSVAILGIVLLGYYAVGTITFWVGVGFTIMLLGVVTVLFVTFVQVTWDTFNDPEILKSKSIVREMREWKIVPDMENR